MITEVLWISITRQRKILESSGRSDEHAHTRTFYVFISLTVFPFYLSLSLSLCSPDRLADWLGEVQKIYEEGEKELKELRRRRAKIQHDLEDVDDLEDEYKNESKALRAEISNIRSDIMTAEQKRTQLKRFAFDLAMQLS